MKRIRFTLFVALCIFSYSFGFNGDLGITTDPSADGSETHPWLIEDLADFNAFCNDSDRWAYGVYTRMECDLDLSIMGTYDDSPIAYNDMPYRGNFNGNGHIIRNLNINNINKNRIGLFGEILYAKIYNLKLDSFEIAGLDYVGGLVAICDDSIITDCIVSGNVLGRKYVSCLCGNNSGSIKRCFSAGVAKGESYVGGLSGVNNATCKESQSVSYCSGTGDVGCLLGKNYGTVLDCCAFGSATGYSSIGGFIGYSTKDVTNCYCVAEVNGVSAFGGFIGNCASTSQIIGCFWDVQACGMDIGVGKGDDAGVTGLDSEQMTDIGIYIDSGWDFTVDDGSEIVWRQCDGWYPALIWDDSVRVEVPDIVGLSDTEGREVLETFYLAARVAETEHNSELPARTILGQWPISGTYIPMGSKIFININLGVNYSGGNGTASEPFQISTVADILQLGATPEDYDKHFILINDINMSGNVFDNSLIAGDIVNDIQFDGIEFSGVFNGNSHSIIGLKIHADNASNVGFFGYIGESGKVFDLEIIDADVIGYSNVGGLAGFNYGDISACYCVNSSIVGQENVGGLCGQSGGLIFQCYSDCTVVSELRGGGLCGAVTGTVSECFAEGDIFSTARAGGIAGANYKGSIFNSYAECTMVSGELEVGGLCGYNNSGNISRCYAVCPVSSDDTSVGGLCGFNSGSVLLSFWDTEVSGIDFTFGGGFGLTTAEMQEFAIYANCSWGGNIWTLPENSYARLAWENAGGVNIPDYILLGSGTAYDPWQISSAIDMILIAENIEYYDDHITLINDIDMSGHLFGDSVFARGIINNGNYDGSAFNGYFDGCGHIISNLNIAAAASDCVGLFGCIGETGTVTQVGLENIYVKGRNRVGGLCGYNQGYILGCYAKGTVSGSGGIGGFCGYNAHTINRCYSSGDVSGSTAVGGFCGYYYSGGISECYSVCSVTCSSQVYDGLFGGIDTYIIAEPRCFWDKTIYNHADDADLGVGLSTDKMQEPICYIAYGWDPDTWVLPESDYPHLYWEDIVGERMDINKMAGSGTEDDPWQIATVEDLVLMGSDYHFFDECFILVNDIDMKDYVLGRSLIANAYQEYLAALSIVIVSGSEFNGVFNGNGHKILNLTINAPASYYSQWWQYSRYYEFPYSTAQYISGVFGQIGIEGEVCDLIVENLNVIGDYYSGGMCGINSGVISRSSVTGTVQALGEFGGFCGINLGDIDECFFEGKLGDTTIYALGGGFCGINTGKIDKSYVQGQGICHSGFCNSNLGIISECYTAVSVCVSGFCSNARGTSTVSTGRFYNCFWDNTLSTATDSVYGTAMTTSQMFDINTYIVNDWSDKWKFSQGDYPHLAWENYISIPTKSDNLVGSGTESDPWQISSLADLLAVASNADLADDYYILVNDIDLSGYVFKNSVISPQTEVDNSTYVGIEFNGVFDGNNKTISNLTINANGGFGNYYIGLFGQIGTNGNVNDLALEYVNISGFERVGGICGRNHGIINGCGVQGFISGKNTFSGGITGINKGMLIKCWSDVIVTASSHSGGICGASIADIEMCYSRGRVDGDSYIGGLCGMNNAGQISGSYSAAAVTSGVDNSGGFCGGQTNTSASISDCFWDTDASGQTVGYNLDASAPGTITNVSGLTTAQMQSRSTFTDSGWDFNAEDVNGSEDVWHMPYQGQGYPMLWYQRDIPGDYVGSYGINLADFAYLAAKWQDSADISDLELVAQYWLEGL